MLPRGLKELIQSVIISKPSLICTANQCTLLVRLHLYVLKLVLYATIQAKKAHTTSNIINYRVVKKWDNSNFWKWEVWIIYSSTENRVLLNQRYHLHHVVIIFFKHKIIIKHLKFNGKITLIYVDALNAELVTWSQAIPLDLCWVTAWWLTFNNTF